jgi:predicted lactoylglutathione lyase
MDRMIFINLPVTDLATANAFYTGLGFSINPDFSDDRTTTCIKVSEQIYLMLLVADRFRDFINGDIAAQDTTEVLHCLSAESRQEVDDLVSRALAHGGKPWQPALREGPMYGHSFSDPDGHVWEVMYMDLSAIAAAAQG